MDEGGSCKRFMELPQICHGQVLQIGLGFIIRKPFPCQSVADPVRSGNVFTDIYWCRSVKDEGDATRTSRMGLGTIRTLTNELWMRYEGATDTKVLFDFSVTY